MALGKEQIAACLHRILEGRDVLEAWLFGSFARGEQTDESDVDIRLVCGPSIGYGDLYEISQELEASLGRSVEIVTNPLDKMRPAFRDRIVLDQVMLYAAA